MRVYIGAPIDTATSNPQANFDLLTQVLTEAVDNLVIYNPCSAYALIKSPKKSHCDYVVQVNTNALLKADLAVFIVDDSPSFGVPIEINQAVETHINVVVWWKSSKNPGLYIRALEHHDKTRIFAICRKEGEVNEAIREAGRIVQRLNEVCYGKRAD